MNSLLSFTDLFKNLSQTSKLCWLSHNMHLSSSLSGILLPWFRSGVSGESSMPFLSFFRWNDKCWNTSSYDIWRAALFAHTGDFALLYFTWELFEQCLVRCARSCGALCFFFKTVRVQHSLRVYILLAHCAILFVISALMYIYTDQNSIAMANKLTK